ncbi:hypothetical protein ACRAWF_36695 [Streptomyces sp. L7]
MLGTLERNGVAARHGTDQRLGERLHRLGRGKEASTVGRFPEAIGLTAG